MIGVTRQVGTVSAADADRVQVRVHLLEYDNLCTNWFNVLQRDTQDSEDYWLSDVGGQVEVLLDANGEDGVILGAVYSDVNRLPFSNKNIRGIRSAGGVKYSYNWKTHTLVIRGGTEHIAIECSIDVVLKMQKATIGASETELTGDLRVRGKLIYKRDMMGSGGEGATATIHGNIETKGNAHATGSMLSDDENSSHHSH